MAAMAWLAAAQWSPAALGAAALAVVWSAFLVYQHASRRRRWAATRDALGRPVKPMPAIQTRVPFGLGPMVQFAVAALRGTEMDEIAELLERDGLTVRLDTVFSEHTFVVTGDPDVFAWITAKNFENYDKGPTFVRMFRELLGEGIFNSNGPVWKRHREIAKPHFAREELTDMVQVFNTHASDLLAHLENAAATSSTVDVQSLFQRFTMDSFGDAFFGADLGTLKRPSEFARHFDYLQALVSWRLRLEPLWRLWPMPKRAREAVAFADSYLSNLIRAARQDPLLAERKDLLAHYLRSVDDRGEPFTDTYLRDMLINFLLAGRDTTASLLTWFFYSVSAHPEIEARLVEEVQRVVGMDADPTAEQLGELRYMRQAINEALRLYPPVPFNLRTAKEDDVLPNGFFVPKGTDISWVTYYFQRSARFWGPDALAFNPDRWTSERAAQVRHFQFAPFHAGPRICLGQNMAHAEAKVAIVRVLQRYQLRHDPTHRVAPIDNIVYASSTGMRMLVARRGEVASSSSSS